MANKKISITLEKNNSGVCRMTYGYGDNSQKSSHPVTEEDKNAILEILNKYSRKVEYNLD